MDCFCGCGRQVPRFPLGLRSVNKRGATHRKDLETVSQYLELGANSPNGEAFAVACQAVMDQIAGCVHAQTDPGPETEAESRALLNEARHRYTDAAIATAMKNAMRRNGWNEDDLALALRRGEFDPFA